MREEVKSWFQQAKYDYNAAKYNLNGRKYKISAFLCQQAVEKALKALLISRTNELPKVHDLTYLAKLNNAPEIIIGFCAKINPAYISSRYPDQSKSYSKKESNQIIKNCNEVLKWIKKNLN